MAAYFWEFSIWSGLGFRCYGAFVEVLSFVGEEGGGGLVEGCLAFARNIGVIGFFFLSGVV